MPEQKDGSYLLVESLDTNFVERAIFDADTLKEINRLVKLGKYSDADSLIDKETESGIPS